MADKMEKHDTSSEHIDPKTVQSDFIFYESIQVSKFFFLTYSLNNSFGQNFCALFCGFYEYNVEHNTMRTVGEHNFDGVVSSTF